MNPTGKKFILLFLVLSLVMLSVNLYAKERRGAKLIITKKDGQPIEGELITVKQDSLLLLNTEGKDESIDIEDIKVIRIVKQSKVLKAAWKGLLFGIIGGALGGVMIYYLFREYVHEDILTVTGRGVALGAVEGVLIGAIWGVASQKSKTIQIEGMTDSEIQETLKKLRKKARVRDYR